MKTPTLVLLLAWFWLCATPAGAQTFKYDAASRLTQVTYADGTTIVYEFDASGDPVGADVEPEPPSDGDSDGGGGGGGCFIATAAYGSALDPHVQVLRDFREAHLRPYALGRAAIALYERWSPPAADFLREHAVLRALTRGVLAPIVYSIAYPNVALLALVAAVGLWFRRRRRRRATAHA